jgi:putative ABC transport system permease protein
VSAALIGLRLALAPAARTRGVLVVAATAVATGLLLVVVAVGRFEIDHATSFRQEMPRIVGAAAGAVALPCVVLLATVARLAAGLRDRRLANLRLMGMTRGQTRVVVAAESGVTAVVGGLVGLVLFLLVRPVLVAHPLAGRTWQGGAAWTPGLLGYAGVLLLVPAVVVLVAVLPARTGRRDLLAMARRADRRPPRLWRLAPLLAGIVLCVVVIRRPVVDGPDDTQIALLFVGVPLLALGLVLVLPVLVRMVAAVLARRELGPVTRIVVRRLEAQPAGVARIVGALLVGLFLVTGARFVVAAFEDTPQYRISAHDVEVEQRATVQVRADRADAVRAELAAVAEVRSVTDVPTLAVRRLGLTAVVLSCGQLHELVPALTGCRDGEPMWVSPTMRAAYLDGGPVAAGEEVPTELTWSAGTGRKREVVARTPLDLATLRPASGDERDVDVVLSTLQADVVLPPAVVSDLPPSTQHVLVVTGPPGRGMVDHISAVGLPLYTYGSDDYDFVATMRTIVWTIAGIVLGVGLLAFAVAALDRSVQRRKEITALRLVGLAPGTLRRAQWFEAALPVGVGATLAIALGALAGAMYLSLAETLRMPWAQAGWLAVAALLASAAVATLASLASAPPLRAEEIRVE